MMRVVGVPSAELRFGVVSIATFVVCACSVDERNPGVAEQVERSLSFGVEATPHVGLLPTGVETGPQVDSRPVTSTVVSAGNNAIFAVAWQGGPIVSVNLQITDNQYFSIPVPGADRDDGVVEIPATIAYGACDELDVGCHQISYYEQVVSTDGNASLQHARQLTLACGGATCGDPSDVVVGQINVRDTSGSGGATSESGADTLCDTVDISGSAEIDGFLEAVSTLNTSVLSITAGFESNIDSLLATFGVEVAGSASIQD